MHPVPHVLPTEQRDQRTSHPGVMPTDEVVALLHAEDLSVDPAVAAAAAATARLVDIAVDAVRAGGRPVMIIEAAAGDGAGRHRQRPDDHGGAPRQAAGDVRVALLMPRRVPSSGAVPLLARHGGSARAALAGLQAARASWS